MKQKINTVTINDVEYVRKDDIEEVPAQELDGMQYVMARTYSAGVFAGYLKERDGMVTVLCNARRIWHWEGAATLSQLAMQGTTKPNECKFPMEVNEVTLTETIEIIPCTEKARKSIASVPIWAA